MGSWLITGESRGYVFEEARFKNPKPKGIVGKGGIGAWELLARYSSLDLSDEDIDGGEEDNVTVGINWYPTPNFRFMANNLRPTLAVGFFCRRRVLLCDEITCAVFA
jgi:phosphate-selective porin OprO and OprP